MKAAIETDVLIIGGGITGVSAAYHLAERGVGVILLERDGVGSKASGVNFGGVRINGREPPEIELMMRAHEFWRDIKNRIGDDCETEFTGYIEFTNEPEKMAVMERWAAVASQHGLKPVLMTGDAIRRRWPWLNPEIIGGVYTDEDGASNPRLVTPVFARAARTLGAVIHEYVGPVRVEYNGRFDAYLGDGRVFRADQLINAAGGWGGQLAEHLGDATPWETQAPQMVVTEPLPYFMSLSVDCDVGGRHWYARQTRRGNVIMGRGPGRADLTLARAFVIPQNYFNSTNIAIDVVPQLRNARIIRTWSGIEGRMPDAMPVIDHSPTIDGLVHGYGFSGHGFALGPASGAVLAELTTAGQTQTDISGFKIGRFAAAP